MPLPKRSAIALSVLGLAPNLSPAAGFALIEQSSSSLGTAFAGAAASAQDASTVYFNPAGMTYLQGRQTSVALHFIQPSVKFNDDGSSASGGNGGDGGESGIVPNFYYVMDINPDVRFGLGINVPFGLATEYANDWQGRYQAVKSEVETLNINPSLAFNINPQWSFGMGANFQYFKATLTNAIDISTICLALERGGRLPSGTCAGAGLNTPQTAATDGFSDLSGSSWGVGYNLGLIYAPREGTRLGLAYRSEIRHTLDGNADFTLPSAANAIPTFARAFTDTAAFATINLPDTLSLSLSHQLNDAWTLLADYTRTGWSSYDRLVVDFENPYKSSSTEVNNWDDSNRYSLGATFAPGRRWIYRAGLAYEDAPVPSAEMRSARIPDGSRTWAAIGLGYRTAGSLSIDVGYAHLFVNDDDINRVIEQTGNRLKGSFDSRVDILSAQLNWAL